MPIWSKLAILLVGGGGIALLQYWSKRKLNIPKRVPIPESFDAAVAMIEDWQHCRAKPLAFNDFALESGPRGTPVRAAEFEVPERVAAGLVERLREPWEGAGLQLMRSGHGFRLRGAPESLGSVTLFDTVDRQRIVQHVGPGAVSGVGADQLEQWLTSMHARQPFRLAAIHGNSLTLAFTSPVGDSRGVARSVLEICPDLQDPATLEPVTEEQLAREIEAERAVSIVWS